MRAFRYRLLFVGVNTVPGQRPLYAARRDAEAMSLRFADWGYDHRVRHRRLVGADATATRILDELKQASSAAPLDLLFVYWAGHLETQAKKHTLATVDGAGVGLDEITAAFTMTTARERVLILDVCHAAAAQAQLSAMARSVPADASLAAFGAGGTDGMSREDLRRGYFTGSLLEHLPRYTRGLPPDIDLLQALRAGADDMPARRSEQPIVIVHGQDSFRLPSVKAKTLPFERKARVGRQPGRLIAASA